MVRCGIPVSASVLILSCLVGTHASSVPAFDVPSFDYTQLHQATTQHRALAALEEGGIVALRNIPNYANVREQYLAKAVDCAVAMEGDGHSEHLSTKQFADGTRRLTLRATAGRELDQLVESAALAVKCPGYHDAHVKFSRMLEYAVDTFAAALDGTSFRLTDGDKVLSSRKLVHEAVRLDHFHAYEATSARKLSEASPERDLSLDMHEDHGMFIAMSAPEFFDVDPSGRVTRRQLVSDESGLFVQTKDESSVVRPVLKKDELVLMAGTGFTHWLEGTHKIPAVMHGMRMPTELVGTQAPGHRHLRAWFGKMTLLPPYQRMLRGGLAFDEFTNKTTRHLKTGGRYSRDTSDLKAIGCAPGRRLVVSEGSCAFRICKPRPEYANTTIFPSCASSCNYEYPSQSQVDRCYKKCECTETTTNAGICWMTCAAWLPESECPFDRQYCLGLTMRCAAPGDPVTPQPLSPHSMPPQLTYHPVTVTPAPSPTTPSPPLPSPSPPTPSSDPPVPSTPAPTQPSVPSPSTPAPTSASPVPTPTSSESPSLSMPAPMPSDSSTSTPPVPTNSTPSPSPTSLTSSPPVVTSPAPVVTTLSTPTPAPTSLTLTPPTTPRAHC